MKKPPSRSHEGEPRSTRRTELNRDDFFRLAVTLAAPTLKVGVLTNPDDAKAAARSVIVAYNTLLLAYSKVPERGEADMP